MASQFSKIPSGVFSTLVDNRAHGSDYAVYIYLDMNCQYGSGSSYPGHVEATAPQIASAVGYCVNAVRKALKRLVEWGLVERTPVSEVDWVVVARGGTTTVVPTIPDGYHHSGRGGTTTVFPSLYTEPSEEAPSARVFEKLQARFG